LLPKTLLKTQKRARWVSPDRGFRGEITMQKNEAFKIITDDTKLDIPTYIDKPEYVRNKTAGYSLLALGWMMWMWLFLPLLTLLFWWFEGNLAYEQLVVAEMPKNL
jgi:biofilm PGA synthesis protein PgaD